MVLTKSKESYSLNLKIAGIQELIRIGSFQSKLKFDRKLFATY
jgi:hypothetical protein